MSYRTALLAICLLSHGLCLVGAMALFRTERASTDESHVGLGLSLRLLCLEHHTPLITLETFYHDYALHGTAFSSMAHSLLSCRVTD